MTTYTITTDHPTEGPWRVTPFGNKYATVAFPDGRVFHVGVEKTKRVRIPYKPRGHNIGWIHEGFVRDSATGKIVAADKVNGSIGVRGLLKLAGLVPLSEKEATRKREYDNFVDRLLGPARR